jgi:trans-aconitate methyltransferase
VNLFELGRKYNSVKCYDRFKYAHTFCKDIYPEHFNRCASTILEIGVHQGGSLRMMEEYFPAAEVYGIDIHDCFKDEGRIHFRQGNQADASFLQGISDEVGFWDIIIDDGSHNFSDQVISFETLWPRLKSGGVYAIEDVMDYHSESIPCIDYFYKKVKEEFTKLPENTDIRRIVFYPYIIIVEKK